MASARRCDRCGEYHDRRIYKLNVEPMFQFSEDEYELDLCPECMNEFTDFMNGVKPKDLLGRLKDAIK